MHFLAGGALIAPAFFPSLRGWCGWLTPDVAVRLAAASVLLIAAGLKTHQLATEPVLGDSLLHSRWFLIVVVQFELFFAFWLMSGLSPVATWRATIGLFVAFAAVSLYKALSGAASCGCFGTVEVNPWYTVVLDLLVVGCLLRWQPRYRSAYPCVHPGRNLRFRLAGMLGGWAAVGVTSGVVVASYKSARLNDAGQLLGDGRTVVLEPERWVGKRFPLLKWIGIDADLTKGRWTVVLHRSGCGKCERLLGEFSDRGSDALLASERRVAFVSFEPNHRGAPMAIPRGTGFVNGSLLDSYEWFGQTPMQLELADGVVQHTSLSEVIAFATHSGSHSFAEDFP